MHRSNLRITCNNLKIGKKYDLKVKTYINKDNYRIYSEDSNTIKISIGKTEVVASAINNSTIAVEWNSLDKVKKYSVYRADNYNEINKKYNFKHIKDVNGKTTAYTDDDVKKNTTYYYKVQPIFTNDMVGTSSIAKAKSKKVVSAKKYIKKRYKNVCAKKKQNMNKYNVNNIYSPVKYKISDKKLEIHVYLEFVSYIDTGKKENKKIIYKKIKAKVNSKTSAKTYIKWFKEGLEQIYTLKKDKKVVGNDKDFKKGVNFDTEIIIHDKNDKKQKYNNNQNFIEVILGGECPNCTESDEHWYHAGSNNNVKDYVDYKDINVIYMPTNEHVKEEEEFDVSAQYYRETAAHELGYLLGLDDAYYDRVDRCLDSSETGEKYKEHGYDHLMKNQVYSTAINANGIEMILKAIDNETGIPVFASQSYKTYKWDEKTINKSIVIKSKKDNQQDKD